MASAAQAEASEAAADAAAASYQRYGFVSLKLRGDYDGRARRAAAVRAAVGGMQRQAALDGRHAGQVRGPHAAGPAGLRDAAADVQAGGGAGQPGERGAHAGGEVPGDLRPGHGGHGAPGDHQDAAGEGAASSVREHIQEEYARMLKELDDQTESLDQEIAKERELKAERAKRHREEALQKKASKKQHLDEENTQLKGQLDDFTSEIRQLQEVFATLEKEEENENNTEDEQSPEERRRLEEERAQNEIVELQQEIVLLKEAQEAITEKIDKQSLKAQYEEEKQEVLEETAHVSIADNFVRICPKRTPDNSNPYVLGVAAQKLSRGPHTSNHLQRRPIALVVTYTSTFSRHRNAHDTIIPATV
ncbi:hypothetical protein ON010_g5468 [Phytophthora cinnamomi]|nr:hypothetical protein ON010_g5468 [Phytophthora cinnamomi]